MYRKQTPPPPNGYTLTELVLTIAILGTISAVATVRLGGVMESSRIRAAEADLATLREGFTGTAPGPGYLCDMAVLPGFSPAYLRVHCLLSATNVVGREGVRLDDGVVRTGYASLSCFTNWNPETARGWRGPYVRAHAQPRNAEPARDGLFPAPHDSRTPGDASFAARGFYPLDRAVYGVAGEQAVGDPWGNPYVLQVPPEIAFQDPSDAKRFHYARLVSAGPDGVLQTPCFSSGSLSADARRVLRLAGRFPDGSISARGDDIVLFLNRPDVFENHE